MVAADWPDGQRERLTRAFYSGSIAPDLGLFPGGPTVFSQRLHHEATADFLRALRAAAADAAEAAFAAGWALHVCTDVAIHPWVNSLADDQMARRRGQLARRRDLWHMRIENGIDCHILTSADSRFLWDLELAWEEGGSSAELLAAVGERFLGADAAAPALAAGIVSQRRWVARLPGIYLYAGHARPSARPMGRMLGYLARPLVRVGLGDVCGGMGGWDNLGAVAKPLVAGAAILQRAGELGAGVLASFEAGYRNSFVALANLDLDTGREIDAD